MEAHCNRVAGPARYPRPKKHGLIAEAQRCIGRVHENNLKVFRAYRGGGKRGLLKPLLAPWLDSCDPYPFNFNPKDPKRFIPPGIRSIGDLTIRVDSELSDAIPSVDDVDYFQIGYPQDSSRYSIKFKKNQRDERILDPWTKVHVHKAPMSDEMWELFKKLSQPAAEEEPSLRSSIPLHLRRSLYSQQFIGYLDDRVETGTVTLETFQSNDFLDRAVTLMLIKEAQGGGTPERVENAARILLNIFESEISAVGERFYRGRMVRAYNKVNQDTMALESVQASAMVMGQRLIVGERPGDLETYINQIGEMEIFEFLQTRRLDQILRYHMEFHVYLIAETYISLAEKIHAGHHRLQTSLSEGLMKRIGGHLQDLYHFFDPYAWVFHDQALFNVTSENAWSKFKEEYLSMVSDADEVVDLRCLQQASVNSLEKKHGIQFSPDAYDPSCGLNLVEYLGKVLMNNLKKWLRNISDRSPNKIFTGLEQIADDKPTANRGPEECIEEYQAKKDVPERDINIIRRNLIEGYTQAQIAASGMGVSSRRQVNRIVKDFKDWAANTTF